MGEKGWASAAIFNHVLQEFLKHSVYDCSVKGTDLFSLDSQIKKWQQTT